MIIWKCQDLLATVDRHDCTTVTSVRDIANIIDDQHTRRTTARPFDLTDFSLLAQCKIQVQFLGLSETIPDCWDRIMRETIIFNYLQGGLTQKETYKLVEVVTEEVSAYIAPMSIINPEEGAFRPLPIVFFRLWLHNIQNYRNSVFIIIPTRIAQ